MAGVNRVGVNGNGHRYSGDTCLIYPLGRQVGGISHQEAVVTDIFSAEVLMNYRKEFPAWMDANGRRVALKKQSRSTPVNNPK